jgi:hypothetical protein
MIPLPPDVSAGRPDEQLSTEDEMREDDYCINSAKRDSPVLPSSMTTTTNRRFLNKSFTGMS